MVLDRLSEKCHPDQPGGLACSVSILLIWSCQGGPTDYELLWAWPLRIRYDLWHNEIVLLVVVCLGRSVGEVYLTIIAKDSFLPLACAI